MPSHDGNVGITQPKKLDGIKAGEKNDKYVTNTRSRPDSFKLSKQNEDLTKPHKAK